MTKVSDFCCATAYSLIVALEVLKVILQDLTLNVAKNKRSNSKFQICKVCVLSAELPQYFLIAWNKATVGHGQALLLALYSGVIPNGAQGTIYSASDRIRVSCMQGIPFYFFNTP